MDAENTAALAGADADALFRMVIETAVDGIVVIDVQGRIMLFNKAGERLFGYTAEEIMGENVATLMPEPYHSAHDSYLKHYLESGEPRIIGIGRDVYGLRKDGSTFPMRLSVGEGRLQARRAFLGICHDITDRRRRDRQLREMQDELFHAQRLTTMGQLASALAHELNQPLTATLNYLNAARRNLGTREEPAVERSGALLDKAAEQTIRAGQIIRRLRDFIEKKTPERTFADLNSCVRDAIALGLGGVADDAVRVKAEFAADLPPVAFDRVQIQQVIVNLLRNAIDALEHAERRETVITTSRPEPDIVEVAVADSGPGISPEMMDNLFQPFTTSKSTGLGMGLTICHSIVAAHGGRLWASSNPGGGALFRFRLPLRDGVEV